MKAYLIHGKSCHINGVGSFKLGVGVVVSDKDAKLLGTIDAPYCSDKKRFRIESATSGKELSKLELSKILTDKGIAHNKNASAEVLSSLIDTATAVSAEGNVLL